MQEEMDDFRGTLDADVRELDVAVHISHAKMQGDSESVSRSIDDCDTCAVFSRSCFHGRPNTHADAVLRPRSRSDLRRIRTAPRGAGLYSRVVPGIPGIVTEEDPHTSSLRAHDNAELRFRVMGIEEQGIGLNRDLRVQGQDGEQNN